MCDTPRKRPNIFYLIESNLWICKEKLEKNLIYGSLSLQLQICCHMILLRLLSVFDKKKSFPYIAFLPGMLLKRGMGNGEWGMGN